MEDDLPVLVYGAGSVIYLCAISDASFILSPGGNSAVDQAKKDWGFLSIFIGCYVSCFSVVAINKIL